MLRVISHIEQLLHQHDCVIVPGIGGFMTQIVGTEWNATMHLFAPQHKEVVFNGSLQHNDGLLVESYMKEYGTDFKTAGKMVEEDVRKLTGFLDEHTFVQMGHIGKLVRAASGQLLFERSESFLPYPESFGLPAFQLKTIQQLQKEEEALLIARRKQEKDIIYIPVRRKLLRGITATAAAVALFFVLSTSVDEVDRVRYSAGVSSLVSGFELPAAVPVETPEIIVVAEEIPVAEEKVEEATPQPNRKMYHIVIGSFATDREADTFFQKKDVSAFPRLNRITRNERVRVYADRFDNREEAEAYLDVVRETTSYKDAWLFISR